MKCRVGLIPGDGIGPEVTLAARRCVESAITGISWERIRVGQEAFTREGSPLAPAAVRSLLRLRLALKGPLEGSYSGISYNTNALLKDLFGIHTTIRRCRSYTAGSSSATGMDMLVIKQEPHDWPRDFELDSDHPAWPQLLHPADGGAKSAEIGRAAAVRFVCPRQATQFFEFALKYAADCGRKRVTVAHRANILRKTDGLWLKAAEEVGRRYTQLDLEDQLVDHVVLQMARDSKRFDVIVCAEPYADMIGDLAVGLAGGLGMVPQAHYGIHGAIFTTVHGTAPKYSGLDRANPCAMILAGAEMLGFLGQNRAKKRIEDAVAKVLGNGARTADLSVEGERALNTGDFAEAVISAIEKGDLRGTEGVNPGLLAGPKQA